MRYNCAHVLVASVNFSLESFISSPYDTHKVLHEIKLMAMTTCIKGKVILLLCICRCSCWPCYADSNTHRLWDYNKGVLGMGHNQV